MRCEICKKSIRYEILQSSLFYFKFICKECSSFMIPKKVEIPIDGGYLIEYYYFLDDEKYESEVFNKLYMKIDYILKRAKNKIVLFLDFDSLAILKYMKFRQNIILISTVYEALDYLFDEDF